MKHFVLLLFISIAIHSIAQPITRGTIYYRQTDTLQYEVTVMLTTRSIANGADSIEVNLGDGTTKYFLRVNGVDSNLNGTPDGELYYDRQFRKSLYSSEHTYNQPDSFVISYTAPGRQSGIANIAGNSINVPFYIEAGLNTDIYNSQPVSLHTCYFYANRNSTYYCLEQLYDTDGDSLVFELTVPLQSSGVTVPLYVYPDQISNNGSFLLDAATGELVWNEPQQMGIYAYAYLVKEFRDGTQISSSVRDQTVFVLDSSLLSTVGVQSSGLNFHLSPNPATTHVTITIDETLLHNTATITDITGRKIAAAQLTTTNLQLATGNWASGVYLVTITDTDGKTATNKLVVNK